jgi:FtsH-binding integral membrane protein
MLHKSKNHYNKIVVFNAAHVLLLSHHGCVAAQRIFKPNFYERCKVNWIVTKYLITAAVVVVVSEFAKRSDKLGSLIAALPLVTVLTLIWLHIEKQPMDKVANHAWYTFWYVVPTLPMFLIFPALLPRVGFWSTLAICTAVTVICFVVFAHAVRRFGIELM